MNQGEGDNCSMKRIIPIIILTLALFSCNNSKSGKDYAPEDITPVCLVDRIDTDSLIILSPKYSKVDLVCETMPSRRDTSVLLCAEACFTGQCLKEFDHFNIAGDHVSNGNRYHGYKCKRNTGAFVYYNDKWQFLYQNYSSDMDIAAANGGCAFAQEMIIHNGKLVAAVRKDSNRNQFRALCQRNDSLCVIESSTVISYGDFKSALLRQKVQEAIYLDMGGGWNHAWYRAYNDSIKELHPKAHNYCTNWITFYK